MSSKQKVALAEVLKGAGYSTAAVGKWHLGGTADGVGLPTRHGYDSYWGMPVTNVQSCTAGHKEYQQATLLGFVLDRWPTGVSVSTRGYRPSAVGVLR